MRKQMVSTRDYSNFASNQVRLKHEYRIIALIAI